MTLSPGHCVFFFTDIEGSTRLWEEQPEEMRVALARHDRLLREAIEGHGGSVFKTVGDAFCAVFAEPQAALAAAAATQHALAADAALYVAGEPLRVRMALHTGAAEHRDDDFFGPPLNRVARLLSVAHGGQVLVSGATRERIGAALPAGVGLQDLGEHRLRDLARPERIFQVEAAGLRADFPPLRTLDLRLQNLPVQPTPVIGREAEIREIAARLREPEVRLLTLTGPGGTGKTRLAIQAAAEMAGDVPDGIFFVDLAPVADPSLVPSAIAQALDVKEAPDRPLTQTIAEYLAARQTLLVLDNFEHLAAAAPVVGELLRVAAGLKLLTTSRVSLHLRGEREFPVPPLSLPDPAERPDPERLARIESVRLFVERAREVRPDFRLTDDNAAAVAEICRRLDGLPLAIELAAARVRILSPKAMLARLQSRLRLLTGGARDLPERQQTLRGAIDWSHDLLDDHEQTLFRRLAVFAGGRTLEAIESVCAPDGELDALEGVASLVDKSLLRQEDGAGGEPRYVMLETIQEYAAEALEQAGEAERIGREHVRFFRALAEEAEPGMAGSAPGRLMVRLAVELANFRMAMQSALSGGDAESAARIAAALRGFWFQVGRFREGRGWLERALASDSLSTEARARALLGVGSLAVRQHDVEAAEPSLEQSLALFRELGDAARIADALHNLGVLAWKRGEFEAAEVFFEECLVHARAVGQERPRVLVNLGLIAQRRGDLQRSEALCEQALTLARERGEAECAAVALYNLADAARRQGRFERAGSLVRESLRLFGQVASVPLATFGLSNLALLTSAQGGGERAARLFGAVEARFAEMGTHVEAADREEYDHFRDAARARLDPDAWDRALSEGAAMTLEQAIEFALEE